MKLRSLGWKVVVKLVSHHYLRKMKMLRKILDFLKVTSPSATQKHPLDIQKYQPEQVQQPMVQETPPQIVVQETPTPTTSSGTETKSEEVTPSKPTVKKAPASKSAQSPKKATSPRTKKK